MSVSPTCMRRQAHINEKMPRSSTGWSRCTQVQARARDAVPHGELIDRYLLRSLSSSRTCLRRRHRRLLAASTEAPPPELKDLVYITDKAYTRSRSSAWRRRWSRRSNTDDERRSARVLRGFLGGQRGREMTTPSTRRISSARGVSATAPTARPAQVHCFDALPKAGHADRRMVWLASYVAACPGHSMLKYLPDGRASPISSRAENLGRNAGARRRTHAQYAESDLHAPQGHARRPPLDEGLAGP